MTKVIADAPIELHGPTVIEGNGVTHLHYVLPVR